MSEPDIPTTADDVDHDFEANVSPPPGTPVGGTRRLGLLAQADPVDSAAADPGHLATDDEWAAIVARAEGRQQ